MNTSVENLSAEDRLLTFELAGDFYAIPIAGVLEVADAGHVTCIPSLPTSVGGVINYHGDALPVLGCSSLFDVNDSEIGELAEATRDNNVTRRAPVINEVEQLLGLRPWDELVIERGAKSEAELPRVGNRAFTLRMKPTPDT